MLPRVEVILRRGSAELMPFCRASAKPDMLETGKLDHCIAYKDLTNKMLWEVCNYQVRAAFETTLSRLKNYCLRSRLKWFITIWFSPLSGRGNCKIKLPLEILLYNYISFCSPIRSHQFSPPSSNRKKKSRQKHIPVSCRVKTTLVKNTFFCQTAVVLFLAVNHSPAASNPKHINFNITGNTNILFVFFEVPNAPWWWSMKNRNMLGITRYLNDFQLFNSFNNVTLYCFNI